MFDREIVMDSLRYRCGIPNSTGGYSSNEGGYRKTH